MSSSPAASRSGTQGTTPQRSQKSPSKPKPPAPAQSALAERDAVNKAIESLEARLLTAKEYRQIVSRTALWADDIAAILQQGQRTVRRHMRGDTRIDGSTTVVMRLLDRKIITLQDIIDATRP